MNYCDGFVRTFGTEPVERFDNGRACIKVRFRDDCYPDLSTAVIHVSPKVEGGEYPCSPKLAVFAVSVTHFDQMGFTAQLVDVTGSADPGEVELCWSVIENRRA